MFYLFQNKTVNLVTITNDSCRHWLFKFTFVNNFIQHSKQPRDLTKQPLS